MPRCSNCKQSGGYYEQYGLYYCSLCDTQSQTMQVMTAEDEIVTTKVSASHSHKIQTKKVHKTSAKLPIKFKFRKVVPGAWRYEIMQLILQAQVKTLIGMGVTPKLEEVVRHLWFLYLHKMNIAFCANKSAKSTASQPSSDSSASGIDDEEEVQSLSKKETEESEPGSPSIISNKVLKESKSSTEEPGENSANDSTNIDDDNDVVDDDDDDKKADSKCCWQLTPSVHTLLCLVSLGLRYVHEPVLLSDLMRLVHENNLPLWYADGLIPPELVKSEDNMKEFINNFCVTYRNKFVLQHHILMRRLKSLHNALHLPRIPSPDMAVVIARYIAALNLPNELNQYTYKLFSLHKPTLDQHVFAHDSIGLAFIVVALKLLFVLDDNVEHMLSERAQRLRSLLPSDVNIFVWDEWVSAANLRDQHRIAEGRTQEVSEVTQVKNVDNFLTSYLKASRIADCKDMDMTNKRDTWDMRQERQKCFQITRKKAERNSSKMQPPPVTRGMATKRKAPDPNLSIRKKARTMKTAYWKHSELKWESRDKLLNADFADYTLNYLLNFDKVIKDYGLSENKSWLCTGERSYNISPDSFKTKKDKKKNSKAISRIKVRCNEEETSRIKKKTSKSKKQGKLTHVKKTKKKNRHDSGSDARLKSDQRTTNSENGETSDAAVGNIVDKSYIDQIIASKFGNNPSKSSEGHKKSKDVKDTAGSDAKHKKSKSKDKVKKRKRANQSESEVNSDASGRKSKTKHKHSKKVKEKGGSSISRNKSKHKKRKMGDATEVASNELSATTILDKSSSKRKKSQMKNKSEDASGGNGDTCLKKSKSKVHSKKKKYKHQGEDCNSTAKKLKKKKRTIKDNDEPGPLTSSNENSSKRAQKNGKSKNKHSKGKSKSVKKSTKSKHVKGKTKHIGEKSKRKRDERSHDSSRDEVNAGDTKDDQEAQSQKQSSESKKKSRCKFTEGKSKSVKKSTKSKHVKGKTKHIGEKSKRKRDERSHDSSRDEVHAGDTQDDQEAQSQKQSSESKKKSRCKFTEGKSKSVKKSAKSKHVKGKTKHIGEKSKQKRDERSHDSSRDEVHAGDTQDDQEAQSQKQSSESKKKSRCKFTAIKEVPETKTKKKTKIKHKHKLEHSESSKDSGAKKTKTVRKNKKKTKSKNESQKENKRTSGSVGKEGSKKLKKNQLKFHLHRSKRKRREKKTKDNGCKSKLNFSYIIYPLLNVSSTRQNNNGQLDKMHKSFAWLLHHCAPLVQQEAGNFYKAVREVEFLVVKAAAVNRGMKMQRAVIFAKWGCQ